MNPCSHWLWLFVIVNVIAALIMYNSGELMGDLVGHPLHSQNTLLLAICLVSLSFLVILSPAFNYISRIRVRKINFGSDEDAIGRRIGFLLIAAQSLYLLFNLTTGVNVAGSNNVRGDSPFSLIWVFFPVDMLFMIYYGLYREKRYFYPNLFIRLI